ncbi:MAG: DivIVA domain-containing protein [Clostridia bacterium]|jgi:divIVA family protein|nr:DivIVA domain-containing protein [Clostridia bacterium]CDC80102.1 divIVA domain [Clostridium sp. CAG:465]
MLTPNDIENKVFKKSKMKGYDIDDVEDFLEQLLADYEALYKENAEIKDKFNAMQESISYYKSVEEGINKTIENAQSTADNMKEVAKREAETIKQEAEADARRHIEELNNEIRRKEELLEDKKKQMQIYRIRVSSMLEAQLKILNEDEDLK